MTKKASDPARLQETAHHEAGHTVAAHFFHLPFQRVTINPDLDRAT